MSRAGTRRDRRPTMSAPPFQCNSAPMGETLGWRDLPVLGASPAMCGQARRRLIIAALLLAGVTLVALAGLTG
ncbi:MAG: hypothetical protein AB7L36_00665 [Sphingomonadaceae bacterium]